MISEVEDIDREEMRRALTSAVTGEECVMKIYEGWQDHDECYV